VGSTAPDRWDHNIHHHPLVLRAVRDGGSHALDVGCGEGRLARELASVGHVTALDRHEPTLAPARRNDPDGAVGYLLDDVLAHPFVPGSFDLVASIAALNHVDATAGLEHLRELLRPGGTLVVVGLARARSPVDLAWAIAGAVGDRVLRRTRTYHEHSAPIVWPPPQTYGAMRRLARRALPGVRFRRHLLWRYSLT
jgi:2-polyprenyl-3-methyl-5-hydroxy-6-metoxy-1,4-benzoquinol methylase